MRIDCQSHVFPLEYAQILARNPRYPKTVIRENEYAVTFIDGETFHMKRNVWNIDRKLGDMDAAQVDMSILSVNVPGPESLIPELRLEAAKVCNDYLANVVKQHPDRFAGIACLPWQDAKAAIQEMNRAIDDLGLCGIMLLSHIGGEPVDSAVFEPIYSHAERRGIPIVMHPTVPAWAEAIKDYSMIRLVGLMVDHSFAILKLILGGVLERHPGLKIVEPHAGGILPYLWGRIKTHAENFGRGMENISQNPDVYYKRVYLDVVSPSAAALRFAYDFAGPDRLILGSDHPWVDIGIITKLVESVDIPQSDKDKIFGLNAKQLFKIN